ncbi:MAG: putative sulfate exporter family transporter [Bacteroidales bacterium]|nr:putative sulfate exporter family transporter [Bacteroidales bacterium]
MQEIENYLTPFNKTIFIVLFLVCLLPGVSPAVALFLGVAFALFVGHPFPYFAKKTSKILLQLSVVGLGFGMNLHQSLKAGSEGMLFTVVSVVSVMVIGYFIGKWFRIDSKTSYLISSGTAICGGSAIAAVAPVLKANDQQISLSMGTIFVLNAIALFIFPPIGHLLHLTQEQFGLWAAIAIHDTSSVVGAGAVYGEKALEIATLVKLTRALWIIPLAFITMLFFREKAAKISIPWFIFFFVLAMVANTYLSIPASVNVALVWLAKRGLTLTLFLIGSGLSRAVLRAVGFRPMAQGIILWVFIAVISLGVILFL